MHSLTFSSRNARLDLQKNMNVCFWLLACLFTCLLGRLFGWLCGWLFDWLIGWLAGSVWFDLCKYCTQTNLQHYFHYHCETQRRFVLFFCPLYPSENAYKFFLQKFRLSPYKIYMFLSFQCAGQLPNPKFSRHYSFEMINFIMALRPPHHSRYT